MGNCPIRAPPHPRLGYEPAQPPGLGFDGVAGLAGYQWPGIEQSCSPHAPGMGALVLLGVSLHLPHFYVSGTDETIKQDVSGHAGFICRRV